MTQQRSNDEIRADIATVGYTTPDSASGWWATERLAADVPALLARVSELEQENVRLHGVIAHTASDVHDYVRAALADARTDLDSALARAERAEAQVRAVEELQGPLNQLQMTWWSDYPGAEHEKEAARRTLVHQLVKGLSAALAAGLSLQEEQE